MAKSHLADAHGNFIMDEGFRTKFDAVREGEEASGSQSRVELVASNDEAQKLTASEGADPRFGQRRSAVLSLHSWSRKKADPQTP